MATPNSPLRVPPLNASNMSDDKPERRDPHSNSAMPPPPTSPRVYYTPTGEQWSEVRLRDSINWMRRSHKKGPDDEYRQHTLFWMLQQHFPKHDYLLGRRVAPPPGTLPHLMHLGRSSGQLGQQQLQASSPGMIATSRGNPVSSGTHRPRGMTIDSALANSSMRRPQNAMSPMQMSSSSGTPRQRAASFSAAKSPFARSPSQARTPGISRTPPALLFKPGSPADFVFQNGRTLSSPSKPSPYRPGQKQYSPLMAPALPYSSGTSGAKAPPQHCPPLPQNGYTTGPVPPQGMFPAPLPPPAASQSYSSQSRSMKMLNFQAPEVRAEIDACVAEELRKFTAQQVARYKEMMGNDYKRRWEFVLYVRENQRRANESTMQSRPAMLAPPHAVSRYSAARPGFNKRKEPHTAIEQPQNKRRVIDLTQDHPPSIPPPSRPVKGPPIPTHLIPQPTNLEAHAHARQHGVYLPDVDMSTYSWYQAEVADFQHKHDVRKAHARLDPRLQNLKNTAKSATNISTRKAVFKAHTPDAMEIIDSVELDNVPPAQQVTIQTGYIIDEDMPSRASEEPMEYMSEQKANLEYELSSFDRKVEWVDAVDHSDIPMFREESAPLRKEGPESS